MVAPLLLETTKTHRKEESREMSMTEMELKSLLLKKKRDGKQLERSELNKLCREIWRKRRALMREKTLEQDQGKCGGRKSSQEDTEQTLQLELDCEKRESRNCAHSLLQGAILHSRERRRKHPSRTIALDRALEESKSGLCRWNADFTTETVESVEQTEKREGLARSNHSRCFESIPTGTSGEAGMVAVDDVLGHVVPGRKDVLVDGHGSEGGGCNVLDQVQADCWTMCDARSAGLRLALVPPTTALRESSDGVCAGNTCGCWSVSAVTSGGIVDRMAKINGGGAAGCENGVRSRGTSSSIQSDETARIEPVLDGIDCDDLERNLHESTIGNGDVEQNSDEQRVAPRCAGISGDLHNDQGTGVERLDKELGFTETCVEPRRIHAVCNLLCGRCGAGGCVGFCGGNNGFRSYCKTQRGWSVSWCTEDTLDESPKENIVVDGIAVLWGEVLEFVGSKVCLDGSARYAIAHRTAQANTCLAKWRQVLNSPWLPRRLRLDIVKSTVWQALLWSSSVWTTIKARETKLRVGVREWWRTWLE